MKIVEFSLRKRVTISMIVVVLVIFGFISFNQLGLDMLPEMEAPYISIITTYSGVSSEDIEESVTRPLEQWVSTVTRVKQIKSISQEGMSIIMVEFESRTNLDFAAQDIREKIGVLEPFLPQGADSPLVVKFNFEDMPILIYGITGGKWDLKALKDHIDKEVAARLERLEGVASAMLFSPEEAEVLINVDKGKLEARRLSISQVERAIQASNINLPSGYMDEKYREYLLRTIGEFEKVEEIRDVVVGTGQQGQPIFLKDIAEIRETNKEIRNLVRINGNKGLILMITKSFGANTVLVARTVKENLEKIKPTLEKDLEFSIAMDFSRIIEIMAGRSANNILMGGILAMLLILFFLRNIRPTLAIGIAIPLSVITTFIALRLMGYTLNLITMGGLALGVGMMVDNAIVVIENIFRHMEEGKASYEAAHDGTSEVGTAITASTFTTIAVFFPMMFATGIAGTFSKGLAIAVSFSLLSSLFVALTIIPMLASWFFRTKPSLEKQKQVTDLGYHRFNKLRDFYRILLTRVLRKRGFVLLGAILLFISAILLARFLGSEFLPDTDRSLIFLKLSMPVGTNLAETDRVVKYIEEQSLKNEHVITTMVNVGVSEQGAQDSAAGFNPDGSYEATMWAYLTTSSKRDISDKNILEQWRRNFPELKTSKIQFVDVAATSFGMSTASPIEFNIFGRELETLKRIAQRVRDTIAPIEGIRDMEISLNESKPEIRMKIKKEEASRLGLTPYEISRQVQTFTIGTVVSRIMLGGEERDIRVRLKEQDRNTVEALKKLPIVTPMGSRVYLSQVVDFKKSFGAVKIQRENQIRKVSVTANYIGRDLGGIVREILDQTKSITDDLPGGYFSQMGGAYKDMKEAFMTMALALLLSIVLVYAVMASQFESLKSPFIIMFTIPQALIGVVILLALTGKNISLPAAMGFIMMSGIVVNNGIVMVDYINQLIARGKDKLEAVIDGAVVRMRPILITALSTMCGMLPMAVATAEGSEMRSPMAITIIGGLMASTFLTLFIVPILYTYFSKIKIKK
ncbi:MAG: efflux RND transporter permease subunit [Candidatus Aminicenantes bacterium]|nr:MAG: efflux RND transporter permease subunit [Candidatus Aminicenantes bacterium]